MSKRRLGMRERRTKYLWLRNTSRYSNEEIWPLVQAAYDATERGLLPGETMPRIIVQFTNTHCAFRGRAYWVEHVYPKGAKHGYGGVEAWRRILVRIGSPTHFQTPIEWNYWKFKDMPQFTINNYREAVVAITAHEMQHALGSSGRKHGEEKCEMNAWDALEYYRKHQQEIDGTIQTRIVRTELRQLAAIAKVQEKKDPNVRLSKQFEKMAKRLEQWKRRLKSATNKVKKYQRAYNRLAKKIGGQNDA